MTRARVSLALVAMLLAGRVARAGGVVTLADAKVAQYREALQGAQETLHGGAVIDPNAADAADQLKRADPAVILAVGQKALLLAKASAPGTPTVFCMVLGANAAQSRTVTGVRLEVSPSAQLALLKQVDPAARRVGVIYDPHASSGFLEEALKAAGAHDVTLVSKPVSDAREVRSALADIAGGIDALWLMPDPRLISAEMFNYLLVFTLERKIALFGFLDSFTQAGALASVAPDYVEIGRRAARLALEVHGRPADARLPVPPLASSPGALSVNLKTARQLGLDVPSGVISKARQVYR